MPIGLAKRGVPNGTPATCSPKKFSRFHVATSCSECHGLATVIARISPERREDSITTRFGLSMGAISQNASHAHRAHGTQVPRP